MLDKKSLAEIAQTSMPFGKYKGRVLIDLPEAYLLWFEGKGFPDGKLGQLMALCLELKIHGLESVVAPLKKAESRNLYE